MTKMEKLTAEQLKVIEEFFFDNQTNIAETMEDLLREMLQGNLPQAVSVFTSILASTYATGMKDMKNGKPNPFDVAPKATLSIAEMFDSPLTRRELLRIIKKHLLTDEQNQELALFGMNAENITDGKIAIGSYPTVLKCVTDWNSKIGRDYFQLQEPPKMPKPDEPTDRYNNYIG